MANAAAFALQMQRNAWICIDIVFLLLLFPYRKAEEAVAHEENEFGCIVSAYRHLDQRVRCHCVQWMSIYRNVAAAAVAGFNFGRRTRRRLRFSWTLPAMNGSPKHISNLQGKKKTKLLVVGSSVSRFPFNFNILVFLAYCILFGYARRERNSQ